MGWNDKKIIDILSTTVGFCPFTCKLGEYEIFIYGLGSSTRSDWNKAGNGYKSLIIYPYKKRSAIFVSEIEDNKCYIHIYQDFKLQKTFVNTIPDAVWKNSGYIRKFSGRQLFGLEDEITLQKLQKIFVPQCASHEWRCSNITPWSCNESKDHKQTLWEKFAEEYPNGMCRTAFMTRLQGSRFVYKDDLGSLCLECNECGYKIFASINTLITAHIKDESLKAFNLDELDEDEAVIIVDYKIRILPHNARETKSQFFGKRGWTLHSSLVYTKDTINNKLNIQVFDYWSDDTGQDAWYTASSLHTISQAIKRHVKLGGKIESGNDIVHEITEIKVTNLLPNQKAKIGTIAGIKSFHE
ncbi:hypothetical protein C1645_833382 [Glomus cerebriforme]|uniref:Uncharacterized protein n=1 Tax=Glomus cerebriforme TaxID=658196 RepID=A0A397SCK3_9GLOM|nr:hypothetical protein C1645_833382 [Glomus cerebriforme]